MLTLCATVRLVIPAKYETTCRLFISSNRLTVLPARLTRGRDAVSYLEFELCRMSSVGSCLATEGIRLFFEVVGVSWQVAFVDATRVQLHAIPGLLL